MFSNENKIQKKNLRQKLFIQNEADNLNQTSA